MPTVLTRRTALLMGLAAISTACGPASLAPSPTAATAKPTVPTPTTVPAKPTAPAVAAPATKSAASPTAGSATQSALRLVPLRPTELGAPPVPAPTKSTAPNAVPREPAMALYDAYGTDAAPGVFPRTIKHATGTTELTRKAERVVPLDSGELDSVVQLGLKPVGYLEYDAALMPDYLVDALTGVKTVGTLAEPNLEALVSLQPDLMLTSKIRHEKIADRLKAIGPTVFGERTGVVWKQNFALHARALGCEVEADATVRAYEDRVRALNAALPNPRPTVSVVRVLNNNLRYYQLANYSGTILSDLGFPRPTSQNVDDFGLLNQSLETLGPMGDADLIVVSPTEGPEGAFAKEMLNSPIWQSLNAVKRGTVMIVNDDVWMAGIGYRSAGVILDDIARHFKI